jgi:hypothetical protein
LTKTNSNHQNDLKYKVYLEERKSLFDAIREGSQSFDKAILTLSAGAFGLSLTFIREIVPHISPETFYMLIVAWICFGVSMLSTLISFLTSQRACKKQIEILEKYFLNDNPCKPKESPPKNKPSVWTNRLNIFSIVVFIIGVIFLATFTILNLREDTMSDNKKEKVEKGFVPPPPPKPLKPDKIDEGFVPPNLPKKPPPKTPDEKK